MTINKAHYWMSIKSDWERIRVTVSNKIVLKRILLKYNFSNIKLSACIDEKAVRDHAKYFIKCKKLEIRDISLDIIARYLINCKKLYTRSCQLSVKNSKYLNKCKILSFNGVAINTHLENFIECESLKLCNTGTIDKYIQTFMLISKNCHSLSSRFNPLTDKICKSLSHLKEVDLYSNSSPLDYGLASLTMCEKLNFVYSDISYVLVEDIAYEGVCKCIALGEIELEDDWFPILENFNHIKFDEGVYMSDLLLQQLGWNIPKLDMVPLTITKNNISFFTNCIKLELSCEYLGDDEISQLINVKSLKLCRAKLSMRAIDALVSCEKLHMIHPTLIGDYSTLIRLKKLTLEGKINIPTEELNTLAKRGLNIRLNKW
jgi:hypothetical protein